MQRLIWALTGCSLCSPSRLVQENKTTNKMVEGRDASKHIIVEQLSSCVHMLYLQYNILTQYSI